jgi:hypothetical protein
VVAAAESRSHVDCLLSRCVLVFDGSRNMKPTAEERIDTWAYSYARSSLIEARKIIDALQIFELQESSEDYSRICIRSMSMTIVILYSRPFGKWKILKDKIKRPLKGVEPPDDLSDAHYQIISMRDQIVAHTDGFSEQYKNPNVLQVVKDEHGFELKTVQIANLHSHLLETCKKLCAFYIKFCDAKIAPIIDKYRADNIDILPVGTYELRFGSELDDWLMPRCDKPYP